MLILKGASTNHINIQEGGDVKMKEMHQLWRHPQTKWFSNWYFDPPLPLSKQIITVGIFQNFFDSPPHGCLCGLWVPHYIKLSV